MEKVGIAEGSAAWVAEGRRQATPGSLSQTADLPASAA